MINNKVSDDFKKAVEELANPKSNPETLLESGLSRIHSKYSNHTTGALTSFRGTKTHKENSASNKQLLAYLLAKNYSVTKVKGAYIENHNSKDAKEVGEESFFVANMKVDGYDDGALEKDLITLGKLYDQDSILIVKPGGDGELVGVSNRDNAFPSKGERVTVGRAKFGKALGQFYSRVKGRQFAFEEEVEILPPQTINGKRVMMIMADAVQEEIKKQQ